jgi:hypothetical protein
MTLGRCSGCRLGRGSRFVLGTTPASAVYVQSTSVNRRLAAGTTLLYRK